MFTSAWSVRLITFSLLASAIGTSIVGVVPSATQAQGIAQPSSSTPVARVNPEQPIRINLVNASGQAVDYVMVGYTGFRRLAPGATAQLSGFPLPANININPIQTLTAINYVVTAKSNLVTVRLLTSDFTGYRSMTIDQTGAIFIF
jgi:hypothetical protein